MRRIAIVIAAALALAGCGGAGKLNTGIDPAKATETVERVEARYLAIKPLVTAALPFLPPSISVRAVAAGAMSSAPCSPRV